MNHLFIYARPAIFDHQHHSLSFSPQSGGHHRHAAACISVRYPADSPQFPEQDFVALDPHRVLIPFIAQIDPFTTRLRQSGKTAGLHHLIQINRREMPFPALCASPQTTATAFQSVEWCYPAWYSWLCRLSYHCRGSADWREPPPPRVFSTANGVLADGKHPR